MPSSSRPLTPAAIFHRDSRSGVDLAGTARYLHCSCLYEYFDGPNPVTNRPVGPLIPDGPVVRLRCVVNLSSSQLADRAADDDLEALLRGDETAFRSLIHRHHGSMLRVAMTYVRDPNIAEDIVQETWLTCLRRLKDFEARSSLKTWIFGILINVA